MGKRVVPEPTGPKPDPLTLGEKATWAVYLPVALIEAVKHEAKEDGFKSASAYAETLFVYAIRARQEERVADRLKK